MEKLTIHNIHKDYNIDDNFSVIHQYNKTLKQWKFFGFRCVHCENTFKSTAKVQKHNSICKEINTIKKRELTMPIQTIMIKGERYYRWGDSGKPYKNRADAEKQAQAAYAAGYKEPMKAQQKK